MRSLRLPAIMLPLLILVSTLHAQDSSGVWSLQRCIAYARSHNIQIRQQVLQKRLSELTLQQSRFSQIPTLNASSDYGYNFGRSIDPTTNQFVSSQLTSAGLSVNTGVTLFNW